MTFHFNVGRSLRKAQADKRVTNKMLADKIGVHSVQVSRWRSSEDLKLSRVIELANHFEMSLDEFVGIGQ